MLSLHRPAGINPARLCATTHELFLNHSRALCATPLINTLRANSTSTSVSMSGLCFMMSPFNYYLVVDLWNLLVLILLFFCLSGTACPF